MPMIVTLRNVHWSCAVRGLFKLCRVSIRLMCRWVLVSNYLGTCIDSNIHKIKNLKHLCAPPGIPSAVLSCLAGLLSQLLPSV